VERVVLVTGAAGFIGFHISQQLVKEWRARARASYTVNTVLTLLIQLTQGAADTVDTVCS